MVEELFINSKDAYATWGVRMGNSFIEALYAPSPMKEVIENKSRLEHGKRVIYSNRKVDERELTLTFTIEGTSQSDYISKYKDFITEISNEEVTINVPTLGTEIYHVYYLRSTSYAISRNRMFSKISVRFCEPNPSPEGRI